MTAAHRVRRRPTGSLRAWGLLASLIRVASVAAGADQSTGGSPMALGREKPKAPLNAKKRSLSATQNRMEVERSKASALATGSILERKAASKGPIDEPVRRVAGAPRRNNHCTPARVPAQQASSSADCPRKVCPLSNTRRARRMRKGAGSQKRVAQRSNGVKP